MLIVHNKGVGASGLRFAFRDLLCGDIGSGRCNLTKNEKSIFFDFCCPLRPESVPTTIMIFGADSDSAVKKTPGVALGGPTGNLLENGEKSEKWQN